MRVVERERARRELFDGYAAIGAGIVLREGNLPVFAHKVNKEQAAGERKRSLGRVGQAADKVFFYDKPVNDDFNVVLFIFVKLYALAELIYITQFIYKSNSYTILENTYSNESLGDWVGYIRKVVAVNDDGKILEQNSMDKSIFNFRSDLDESAIVISFLNVYTDSDDTDYLIVDVNEGHHKAILTEKITTQDTIFDFTSLKHESLSNQFKINPENATQLI